ADRGALSASGDGTNDRAESGAAAHFGGVRFPRLLRFSYERIGVDGDRLAVGGVQPGQLDRDRGDALDLAAFIRTNHASFQPRATLGDHQAVDNQRLIEVRGELVAGHAALGGEPVNYADRD